MLLQRQAHRFYTSSGTTSYMLWDAEQLPGSQSEQQLCIVAEEGSPGLTVHKENYPLCYTQPIFSSAK